jgi:hypothetical protein
MPPPTADTDRDIGAETLALTRELLERIAEDPMLRPSHRVAARRHLASLGAGPQPDVLSADAFKDAMVS